MRYRLTEKTKSGKYCYLLGSGRIENGKAVIDSCSNLAINKLGHIEDFEDKHNIDLMWLLYLLDNPNDVAIKVYGKWRKAKGYCTNFQKDEITFYWKGNPKKYSWLQECVQHKTKFKFSDYNIKFMICKGEPNKYECI